MKLRDIERLLIEAKRVTNHTDYVIIGSLSVFGVAEKPPAGMVRSIDVDLYPRDDPGRASELGRALGEGSDFDLQFGFYADPVSPNLATLPEEWESRLNPVHFPSGVTAWFLDLTDAAISKYARGETKDERWIRAGLRAGLLTIRRIDVRLRSTVMETDERKRLKKTLAIHRKIFEPDED